MSEAAVSAYKGVIDDGLAKMIAWVNENNINELPEDVWQLPKDCPLWNLGLSLAQASGIHSVVRKRLLAK